MVRRGCFTDSVSEEFLDSVDGKPEPLNMVGRGGFTDFVSEKFSNSLNMTSREFFASPVDKTFFSPENTDEFAGTASRNLAEKFDTVTEFSESKKFAESVNVESQNFSGQPPDFSESSPRNQNVRTAESVESVGWLGDWNHSGFSAGSANQSSISKQSQFNSIPSSQSFNAQLQVASDDNSDFSSEKSGVSPVNSVPVRMITAQGENSQPEGENQLVQWAESPPSYQSDCETEGEGAQNPDRLREMEDFLIAAGWVPPRNQGLEQNLPDFSANFSFLVQTPQLDSQFGNKCPEFGTHLPQIEGGEPVLLLEDRFSVNRGLTASEGMLISTQPAPENLTSAVLMTESSNLAVGGPARLLNQAGSNMEIRGDEEMEPELPVFQPPVFGPQPPESNCQMMGGDDFDSWDQWAYGVDCYLQELSRSITNWESIIPPQVVIENRLENFQKNLAEKNAKAQAELLQFIHENLEKRTAEMCSQFEHEKQKSQEQIQQSVSQFILRCQEGGSAVENIANCHKQLLGIEVQRQIEGKFHDFEKKLRDFLGSELAQLESRGNAVQNKLFAPGGLVEQVGICLHSVEGIKSDFQKEILAIRQANRELCSGVDKKFAEIVAGLKMVGEKSKFWDLNPGNSAAI
eukprot:EG_transcript_5069